MERDNPVHVITEEPQVQIEGLRVLDRLLGMERGGTEAREG